MSKFYTLILLEVAIVLFCTVLITSFFMIGIDKIIIIGLPCVVFSKKVFAAPLAVVVNVQFMPFLLSLGLTINGIAWFAFSLIKGSLIIIAGDNILNAIGVAFGVILMRGYGVYRNAQQQAQIGTGENALIKILYKYAKANGSINPNFQK
ncbi:hypothetical protein CDL12_24264 [Handroanthus impetiginosus]|uniref:Uncharacterized protein n=1 Tax=Handroanthus impetiginosus TaxID=429701 RepID=A0A2G9GDD8_9LAMI|nr:hypothetical protein CDL12_24264 [Handroanthus impetiginosus]